MQASETKTLSVRIPRDAYRKLEKIAEATGVAVSDIASLFLDKKCKQPARKRQSTPAK